MNKDVALTTPDPLPEPTAALPSDPIILQQMIVELLAILRDTRRQNEDLQNRLDLLLRRLYGPRTERFDPNQPLLFPDAFDADEAAAAAQPNPEPTPAAAKQSRPHGRKELSKNLKRVTRVHELTAAER